MLAAAQGLALAAVLRRLSGGRRRHPPLRARDRASDGVTVSAVIPARDEEERIGPCLQGLMGDSSLVEVLVVDDGSRDATVAVATALGARVIAAGPPPDGWVGKPWALQRGLEEARGDIVVSLDADTRPQPGLAAAAAAALEAADLVSVGARFECERPGERWLHAALLTTLVYRFGPLDSTRRPAAHRVVISGQCTAVRRQALRDAGGYAAASGHLSDDAALARALAARGWRIAFRDGGDLLTVDMHESLVDCWREWGRTIALGDVTSPPLMAADLATVWLTLGVPLLRVAARRGGRLDLVLLALRLALAAAMAPAYTRRGAPYWLSPLADPVAAARLTLSVLRPPRRWRGRVYGAGPQTARRRRS